MVRRSNCLVTHFVELCTIVRLLGFVKILLSIEMLNTVLFCDLDLFKCHFSWHTDYERTLSELYIVLETLITVIYRRINCFNIYHVSNGHLYTSFCNFPINRKSYSLSTASCDKQIFDCSVIIPIYVLFSPERHLVLL